MARPGDYMATINFTDSFHHVAIHLSSRTILGFEWNDMTYEYNVLLFVLEVV